MNFVGKMLIIIIMLFSVLFMGLTTVVFMTAEDWKDKSEKAQSELTKAKSDLVSKDQVIEENKAAVAAVQKQLDDEKTRHQGEVAQLVTLRTQLEDQKKDLETQRQVTQQLMESAQSEAKHRIAEASEIREKLRKTQDDSNTLQRQQTQLNEEIFNLKRNLATATGQNKNLREEVQAAKAFLQSKGYSTDLAEMKGVSVPPAGLNGIIRRANSQTPQKAELSIGSDDGLQIGHELYVYRQNPPEFLGKLKVLNVEPDQAVAEVIGKTYLGKRLQQGDVVSATLPRGN